MSTWKDLPNASHIDWVLESLKTHRQLWHDIYNKAWHQAFSQAWSQAYGQARDRAREEAWYQARDQAWGQARRQTGYQAYNQASGACIALIAYDDCNKYLSMTSSELEVWARISEDPRAVLLLSMVQVKEKLKELKLEPNMV